MSAASPAVVAEKSRTRSRMTNGSAVLPGIDGRSAWVRRLRDLIELHTSDLGGPAAVSMAEQSVVRRASTLVVELEMLEARFAEAGGATADELDLYARVSGNLRRLYEATGLQRRARDVTPPDPLDYAREVAGG